MSKGKSVVMFVIIVHEMDFAKKIEMNFENFLKEKTFEDEENFKKKTEEEQQKHAKFDPSKFKLVCAREIDQLDLLLENPGNHRTRTIASVTTIRPPKQAETKPDPINYLIFIAARQNESLLTTNDFERVVKKHGANFTMVHKFKNMNYFKKFDSSIKKEDIAPENGNEDKDEFLVWKRYFEKSIRSVGKQLAFENRNKISTPTGELSLVEVPSTH